MSVCRSGIGILEPSWLLIGRCVQRPQSDVRRALCSSVSCFPSAFSVDRQKSCEHRVHSEFLQVLQTQAQDLPNPHLCLPTIEPILSHAGPCTHTRQANMRGAETGQRTGPCSMGTFTCNLLGCLFTWQVSTTRKFLQLDTGLFVSCTLHV